MMNQPSTFYTDIRREYDAFLTEQSARFPADEVLKIDLHCHDRNSDVTDELWGRILRVRETWLETDELVAFLERNGTGLVTVTNHNNARSCWDLVDKGLDVLVGAEFTCHFTDSKLSIHVLTYGFTPEQEVKLNTLRHNIDDFVRYTKAEGLVTVLPHPLYFYTHDEKPELSILERFAVMFTRFEVLNGQRGYWQNAMTRYWLDSLTPAYIDECAAKHGLNPEDYSEAPYEKFMTGGSDDHNGIFAGRTGTLVHIPNLSERLKTEKRSDLVLEAIREGRTAPYGEIGEDEKLSVAFLDYFAQVAMNLEDPGLLRLITHKGSLEDKLACLAISNLMQELKRHKYTLTFLRTFHEALSGTKPAMLLSLGVSKDFKPALKVIKKVAKAQRKHPDQFLDVIREGLPEIYKVVTSLFFNRLDDHLKRIDPSDYALDSRDDLIRALEVPTHFRALLGGGKPASGKGKKMTSINVGKVLDELTFPALAAIVIGGASFAAKQVLNSNRAFTNELAQHLGKGRHPERVLWLTDTLADKNGVSHVLQNTLDEIREKDYPIDLLTCHPTLESGDHLHVVRPVFRYSLSKFGADELCVPDILEVQTLFERGGYDRIICSTELMMGVVALYLKTAFTVPAHFFMHTDWMAFSANKMSLDHQETDRVRRLLRSFYQQFDGLFVLNNEHKNWLLSDEMELSGKQVVKTNHWVAPCFRDVTQWQRADTHKTPLLMFVGRLSEEKGVFDLPKIFRKVRETHPTANLWIVGEGPARKQLEIALPEATFLGWAEHSSLPNLYRQADLLLLPSRFDTFGCVVLEAMSCGLPVAAYNSKGPSDIIDDGETGYLVSEALEMADAISNHLNKAEDENTMREQAYHVAQTYQPDEIMAQILTAVGLEHNLERGLKHSLNPAD